MPKNYSQKQFEKDLEELENLIKKNNQKGGKKNKHEEEEYEEEEEEYEEEEEEEEEGEEEEEEEEEPQYGGKIKKGDKTRKFTVCHLNGKELSEEIGHVEIKVGRTPLNAARKLLKSIAKHMKLNGSARHNLKVTFTIRETGRDSKHKMYGPYHGSYKKYTPEEMKKAQLKKVSQGFTMKPIVKLAKNQKGGK